MATATAAIEQPTTELVRVSPASTEIADMMRSVVVKVKHKAKKGYKATRYGIKWLGKKAMKAFRWAKKRSKVFALWNLEIAKKTRAVITTTALGVWEYTRPFRGWVATPFRLALGTTTGLAAVLTFGTQTMILLTAPWLVFLLVSGRMVMVKKRDAKVIAKVKHAKKHAPKVAVVESIVDDESGDPEHEGGEYEPRLGDRLSEVTRILETHIHNQDKNMSSEYAGRKYLLQERSVGRGETVNATWKRFKNEQIAVFEREMIPAHEIYTWTAVRRGMDEEQKIIDQILNQEPAQV